MITILENKLDEIIKTCREMQVKSLYLFGSATRKNDFTAKSDLDFLFRFNKGKDGLPLPKYDYFDLLFRLEEITNKKVDLVAEEKISNKYFLERVNKEKIKIYES